MLLGIDVGGTHTDGACLNALDMSLVRTVKTPTDPADLSGSLLRNLTELLEGVDPALISRLVVSGTLGLNAVITNTADPVGILTTGGPGLPAGFFGRGPLFKELSGSLDHRGEIVQPQSEDEVEEALRRLLSEGAETLAIVGKFSPKNPVLEESIAETALRLQPGLPCSLSGRLGGLNFPRRLNTAVINSSVLKLYRRFIEGFNKALHELGLRCPLRFLTSDGGAVDAAHALQKPVNILAAGPAAGLLGLWALTGLTGDGLMIDVGGTSTDLALMADGSPLMTAEGLEIAGKLTSVRSFLTRSVALGGDSALWLDGADLKVGPQREGVALAFQPEDLGRRQPTLTDALNVLGLSAVGDSEVSHAALARMDAATSSPEIAARALWQAAGMIKKACGDLLGSANQRPVYTVDALRFSRPLTPARAALLGGPARALAGPLAQALELPVDVPEEAAVANAIGAARSRPCFGAELYADTAGGRLTIAELGISKKIDRNYHLQQAEEDILAALNQALESLPESGPARIISSESFNQLNAHGRSDRIIKVRAQAVPGFLGQGEGGL